MAVPLRLKVFKGEELIATRDFDRDMIKIGRLSTAHLCLDDEKASRIHSVISVEGDGKVSVVDMGSIEGTFLNGKRINKGFLQFGDEIRIGGTRILVEATPAAEDVSSAGMPAEAVPGFDGSAALAMAAPVAAPAPAPLAPEEPALTAVAELPVSPTWESVHIEGRHRVLLRRPAEFGSYRAQAPIARRAVSGKGQVGLQIRYCWGDTLIQVTQHEAPANVFVGSSRRSELHVSPAMLGAEEFALVSPSGDGWALNLMTDSMVGEIDREGVRSRLGAGTHDLQPLDFAWVEIGGIRAEVSFAQQSRQVVVPLSKSIDYRFINMLLLLLFVGSGFVITATTHTEADVVADDLSSNKLKVAKFLIREAEKPKKNALLDKLSEIKDPQPGEMAERHKGSEGKMGKANAPVNKNNRSAPRALNINAKDLVKNSGILKTLGGSGGGGGGLSTIFGQGGLGGDIKGALGNMFGSQVGDSGGFGGLGLKGTGTGGGGMGNTIGIGGIGTKGRGGGLGSYGTGVGSLDPKKGHAVNIDDSESVVQGSLDKELIRQVIRRNIGQIRYCYENELQTKPNLAGKVAVRFVISANGDVQSARAAEGSTLNDSRLNECITVRVRGWKFPSPKGGGSVIVTYPFVFKQSGE